MAKRTEVSISPEAAMAAGMAGAHVATAMGKKDDAQSADETGQDLPAKRSMRRPSPPPVGDSPPAPYDHEHRETDAEYDRRERAEARAKAYDERDEAWRSGQVRSRSLPVREAGDHPPEGRVTVTEKQRLDSLVSLLPVEERTSFNFSFRKLMPGAGKGGGGGIGTNCGFFYPVGDDWQTGIKVKLAERYGPGMYEGTIRNQRGQAASTDEKWTFHITDEEAVNLGWKPGQAGHEDGSPQGGQASATPAAPAAVAAAAQEVDQFDPDKEQRRAQWLEKRIKSVELEKRLKAIQAEEEDPDKTKKGPEDDVSKLVEAERRASAAERDAAITKAKASADADRARLEAALERERDSAKSLQVQIDKLAAAVEDARRHPPAPPPDPLEIAEKVRALAPDPIEQMSRLREFLPAQKEPEKMDFTGAMNALSVVLQPLVAAAVARLSAPPAPQADPLLILERVKALQGPPPKTIDPVELAMKVKELMPPAVDPFAMLDRAKALVAPQTKGTTKQDVMAEMREMNELVRSFRGGDDDGGGGGGGRTGITSTLEEIKALKELGLPISIGGEQPGGADRFVQGAEKIVLAAGEALAKAGVFKPTGQQGDPAVQAEIARRRIIRQRQQAAAQRRALGVSRQPQPGQPPAQPPAAAPPAGAPPSAQAQQPPAAAPQAGAQPAPAQKKDDTPTSKDWGELCQYVGEAIEKLVDPSEAALHMLEKWPAATMMIAQAPDVSIVDMGLTRLSADPNVGAFGATVAEVASKIRNEPGRGWADLLLKALRT